MPSLEDMTEDQRNSLALKKLFNHPDVGSQAKRLWKKITPDAKFSDLEIEDRLAAQKKEFDEKFEKQAEEDLARRVAERRRENHAMLRDRGLDPDAVEKVMTEEKIASYETAAKYMLAQNRNSAPSPGNVTPITLPDDAKEISKNPTAWARKTAYTALDELRQKRGF